MDMFNCLVGGFKNSFSDNFNGKDFNKIVYIN